MWQPKSYGFHKPMQLEQAAKEYGGKAAIKRAFTYKALNRLIQGSSADQTKKAMVDCYAEGLLPMLTVHDELCFNIESQEQADRIVEIMTTCVPNLNIPFEVDAAIVDNWGEESEVDMFYASLIGCHLMMKNACFEMRDDRGPYETEKQCEERIDEMLAHTIKMWLAI